MAIRLSRRKLSRYFADSLVKGESIGKLSRQLAAYLIDSRRKNEVSQLIGEIEYQLSARGIVHAKVVSARSLSESVKSEIANLVKKNTGAKDVQISQTIDKSVIGGLKLEFTDMELDTTVAKKISRLKTEYKR